MAKQKTIPTSKSVEDYIKALPSEKKIADANTILALFKKITKLEPKMWGPSIIGFGSYKYKYESGREGLSPEIAFSPRKTNLVFYVMTNFPNQEKLLSKLGKHRTGKICLYVNKLADVEMDVLEEIIISCWKHDKMGC